MALTITGNGFAEWAPGSILVTVSGGVANAALALDIDSISTGQTATLGPDGALPNLTVVLPTLSADTHSLGFTGGDVGYYNFTVHPQPPAPASVPEPPSPSALVVPGKWQLEDPVSGDVHVFAINPTTASSGFRTKPVSEHTTTTGHPLSSEGAARPGEMTITGFVEAEAEHVALALWVRKPHRTWMTDDLGRTYTVVFTSYAPVPLSAGRTAYQPYRATYTITADVFA